MSEPFSTEVKGNDEDIKLNSSKKGLIIVSISILLILIAIGVILYFILSSGPDSKNDESGDTKKYTNYILAKYNIFNTESETKLFYNSYIDSIESIKIDGQEEKINCTKIFNNSGVHSIEIVFKNKLTSLESLFYYAESLIEVDLSNLNFVKNCNHKINYSYL